VGFAALAALLVAYLVYARLTGTPAVDLNVPDSLPGPIVESTGDGGGDPIGTIAGVGIGALERPRFFHTNEKQQVDREMGFEELLHKEGDQWEITNPFMRLFLPEFRCDVTADRGTFQLETAFGRPMPNDALFEGNVVIHIVPPEPNDPMECFIYLDDVAFVADKSMFSSSGSVEFTSRSAALEGTGLELLYDSGRSRLELFRIMDLDALRLRSAEIGSLSDLTSPETPTAAAATDANAPAATVVPPRRDIDAGAADSEPNGPAGDLYRCVFYHNVVIEAPEQVIVAREQLSINDILWSESKNEEDAGEEVVTPVDPNADVPLPIPGPNALDTSPSPQLAFDAISEELYDIVVTCDGGFVVAPTDAVNAFVDPCDVTPPQQPREVAAGDSGQRAIARHCVPTADTTLAGPVELTLYVDPNGLGSSAAPNEPVPLHVTARKSVRFLAVSNQVLFEGDCVATLEHVEPDARYQHTLMAPRFTLSLAVADEAAPTPTASLDRFAAHGGSVSLVVLKRADDELIGWTGFEASRMDYEAGHRLFTAYGPGVVALHTARAADPPPEPNQITLDRPCYARLRNFDLLTYSAQTNKIVAEAGAEPIRIDYVPVEDDVPGEGMHADAGYFEVTLRAGPDGRAELDWLSAADGITYWDEKNRFAGGRLTYDHDQALMLIVGDATQPCYFNGMLVDEIEWDLKTDRLKADIPEGSVVQVAQ
jgi:hypothetical protein